MRYSHVKQIAYKASALGQIRKLPKAVSGRIVAKIEAYAAGGSADVTRLKGQLSFRLRVGDWRVIFTENAHTITILAVGHRREIYH